MADRRNTPPLHACNCSVEICEGKESGAPAEGDRTRIAAPAEDRPPGAQPGGHAWRFFRVRNLCVLRLLRLLTFGLGFLTAGGTLLSFSRCQHWSVRLWDFPRAQITAASVFFIAVFRAFFFRGRIFEWSLLGANLLALLWQARKIRPYTRLARVQVKDSENPELEPRKAEAGHTFRLLISNVLMENRQHRRLIDLVHEQNPDVVLAVETNLRWARALSALHRDYPHIVSHPQENYYGMILLSRLPLIDPEIRFLVQNDVPSVHTAVELRNGERIFLHGLHPRPPEPIRDQDSTPRDAELVLVGRAIRDAGIRPTVVAGDLNDVAWSRTSELFLRLSGLLDPRVGRGFYNSYHAGNRLLRYPLDHVFHSNHFRLVDLQRLPSVGSDHFPMLIELSYEPEAQKEQPSTRKEPGDEQEAGEKMENQAEAAKTGEDRPRAT